MDKKVISTNRKAFHDFLIFDKFIAGMVLTGTEIKSIRKGTVNLKDSFHYQNPNSSINIIDTRFPKFHKFR